MAIHNDEIAVIANNPEPATFENTLVALEKSGTLLFRSYQVFHCLVGASGGEDLMALEAEVEPRLSEHWSRIYQNEKLFLRVSEVYNQREGLNLAAEDQRLLELYFDRFVLAGAQLSRERRQDVIRLNKRLSELGSLFSRNAMEASRDSAIVVEDVRKLAGLSERDIQMAAEAGVRGGKAGEYLLALSNTTRQVLLSSLKDRDTRRSLWLASARRASSGGNNNHPLLLEMVRLRAELAQLLGFKNWAEYQLRWSMAGGTQAVMSVVEEVVPYARDKANEELAHITARASAELAESEIKPWDWLYYSEQIRNETLGVNHTEVANYFELNQVMLSLT